MSHPDEQLAEYVDGTLPTRDRAVVDAHLASCGRCRSEVELAGAGRSALASIPEVPAPEGLLVPALERAGAVAPVVPVARPRWHRLAGAAAAAAAAVLVLALVLPNLGGGPGDEAARDRAGGEAAPAAGADTALADAPSLEILQADYDADDLQTLTQPYVERFASEDGAGGGGVQEAATLASRPAGPAKRRTALRCLATAAPQAAGQLQRLLQARFQGEPAYFAIYLEGPGGGQRPDKVTVYVVATEGCTIRSFAQARI